MLDTFSNLELTSVAVEQVQDYAICLLSTADSALLPVVVKYLLKSAGFSLGILFFMFVECRTNPGSVMEVLALWKAIRAQLNDYINATEFNLARGKESMHRILNDM